MQFDIAWEDAKGNLEHLEHMFDKLSGDTDLVLLPETFSTGFTMNTHEFASESGDWVHRWMCGLAARRKLHLGGSIIVREGGKVFNRLLWVGPDGISDSYDKRHLFRMGREDRSFTPGRERKVFEVEGIRFLPQICYDLRFPVFARNRNDYDVLFYVANWPAPRHHVWETLLRARAIENQAYVIGINRCGMDGEGVDHLGGTCLISPRGEIMEQLDLKEGILQASLDIKENREFREKFPVWKDADNFDIRM